MVMIELVVAIALLTGAMLPLAYSFVQEQRLARAYYYRAVAIEIVDGEFEALRAGEWRAFPPGQHQYQARADASTNLPAGQFLLTVEATQLQLEWRPARLKQGGRVVRKAAIDQAALTNRRSGD